MRAGKDEVMCSSRPCKATLASSGETTPPCGHPSSVGVSTNPSMTPALSQLLMTRLKAGEVERLVESSCLVLRSEDLAYAASHTILSVSPVLKRIASFASL